MVFNLGTAVTTYIILILMVLLLIFKLYLKSYSLSEQVQNIFFTDWTELAWMAYYSKMLFAFEYCIYCHFETDIFCEVGPMCVVGNVMWNVICFALIFSVSASSH